MQWNGSMDIKVFFHGIIDVRKEPLFIKEGSFPGALEEEKNNSLHK